MGIAGVLIGVLFIVAGGYFMAFPGALVVPQADFEGGRTVLMRVSKEGCRLYGLFAVVFGTGLIWLARWPRWGARRRAIDDYVWGLSQKLSEWLGHREFYSVEEVSRISDACGYEKAYLAYAHAMFCSRSDFDEYYGPLRVACTYDGLRDVISRRYFDGALGFNAATIVRHATPPLPEEFTPI